MTSMLASPKSEGSDRPLFSAREVVQFYQKHANKVFPQPRGPKTWRTVRALNGPKYKPRGLHKLLDECLESDPLLDKALTSVIIPAFDIKTQQPVFFSSWQARRDPLENPPIKAVCRATSAAATYFPPVHFTLTDTSREPNETREFNLIDGGVVVNNPTYVAMTQAIREAQSGGALADRVDYSSYNDFLVLSLGTGLHTPVGHDARDVAKWGIIDWLASNGEAPLVNMVFNASADMVDYNVSAFFQSQQCAPNYLRIQSDSSNGPLTSLDDSSKSSLSKLISTAKHLLDEPVMQRNFQTGKLVGIACGGTNREALYRFAEWLSEERKTRLATEPPPAPVDLAPPPIVMETPSPPPEAADPAPAEESKPVEEAPAAAVAETPAPAPAVIEEASAPAVVAEAPPQAAAVDEAKPTEELGEDAPTKKEEKAYVTFPYVPRAKYFEDPPNQRRVDTTYVPYSDPAYRFPYSPPPNHNSNSNWGYSSNPLPSYMPSPFEDTAYRTRSPYEPSPFPSYHEPPYPSSRQEEYSSRQEEYSSFRSYSPDPRYSPDPSYSPDPGYSPPDLRFDQSSYVTAAAYERPSFESQSTSYAATPEPTQYASYGDHGFSAPSSSYSHRELDRSTTGYRDLFGFFS